MDRTDKSTFVTVVAWIFIVLSGFATLISALQNIAIWFVFPRENMTEALEKADRKGELSGIHQFMFEYFDFFFVGFFLVVVLVFISSIGLLRRRNWARIVFIGLMGLGILWNVAGLFFMFLFFGHMPGSEMGGLPTEFETMKNLILWMNVVFVVLFTALFAWITIKLMSPAIRQEFA